jgi:hypothetical protein
MRSVRRLVVLLLALPVAAVVMLLSPGMAAAEAAGAAATVAAPSGQDRAFLRAAHQANLVEIFAGTPGCSGTITGGSMRRSGRSRSGW